MLDGRRRVRLLLVTFSSRRDYLYEIVFTIKLSYATNNQPPKLKQKYIRMFMHFWVSTADFLQSICPLTIPRITCTSRHYSAIDINLKKLNK